MTDESSLDDCSHDAFERVAGLNAVYECRDCGGRIVIPRFRWIGEAAVENSDTCN